MGVHGVPCTGCSCPLLSVADAARREMEGGRRRVFGEGSSGEADEG